MIPVCATSFEHCEFEHKILHAILVKSGGRSL